MKYIFIDPSGNFEDGKGHTGIATMIDDDWSTLKVTSLAAKNYKTRLDYWKAVITVIRTLIAVAHNNATVIIESFQIRTNGFLIGKMPETIMLIGAIVWGIYGLFDVNIVAKLFNNVTILEKAIYVIVGVCGLINIGLLFTNIED